MSGDKTHPLDPCPICAQMPELIRFKDSQITPNVKCNNPACLLEGREFDYLMWQGVSRQPPTLSPQGLPPAGLREAVAKLLWNHENRADMEPGGAWIWEVQKARLLRLADKILALLAAERERGGEG